MVCYFFFVFSTVTNTWRSYADFPSPRTGIGMCIMNNKMYVFGGEGFSNWGTGQYSHLPKPTATGAYDIVDVLDPRTNEWGTATKMNVAMHGLYPVVYNGVCYVAGGCPQTDRFTSTNFLRFVPANP